MEAVDGNDRSDSFELGLAENKGENGDKKIDVDNSQNLLRLPGRIRNQLPEEEGGVVLIPVRIESIL